MSRSKTSQEPKGEPSSPRGILAGARRLEPWLHAAMVVLTLASAVRYSAVHGLDERTALVMVGAALLVVEYAAFYRVARLSGPRWAPTWTLLLVATWTGLVLFAPSFAWVAVPLAFLVLQELPFRPAVVVLVVMMLTVVLAWTNLVGTLDPTIILGPLSIAILAVVTYRALERESSARQALLEELREAQSELADAEHRAGVTAERARLSREIHDSLAQTLTSINLLLQAAGQLWDTDPLRAREDVTNAAAAAREGLTEVRRVVQDLAPEELGEGGIHAGLAFALEETCQRALAGTGIASEVRVHGEPHRVDPQAGAALLRSTRGLLANVVEHADASRVVVTVTYQPDGIAIDVRDDGRGFDPEFLTPTAERGHGLAGIRGRAKQFGGRVSIESAPGTGTTVAVWIPAEAAA